ncbi:MAG: polyprenyl synthetase family protein, partial [Candidatus Micrarchaeaceae archaeon]
VYQRDMLKISIGQATDLAWHSGKVDLEQIDESKYLQMAYSKTGVLIGFSAELAGILCGVDARTLKSLGNFGSTIGVAFQITDDILNLTPSKLSENKGGVGDDISEGKVTLMLIHVMKEGNEKDKQRIKQIISMHTSDIALVNEAISIMRKYGAMEYASKKAEDLIKSSWKEIDEILPKSQAKERLKKIVNMLSSRKV